MNYKILKTNAKGIKTANYDTYILLLKAPKKGAKKIKLGESYSEFENILNLELKRTSFIPKAGEFFSFQHQQKLVVTYFTEEENRETFFKLETARKIYETSDSFISKAILVDTLETKDKCSEYINYLSSAFNSGQYELPSFKSGKKTQPRKSKIDFLIDPSYNKLATKSLTEALATSEAGNEIRTLLALPANKLTPADFDKYCRTNAKKNGFSYKFHTYAQLKKSGAGAFCAVAQANPKSGAGIAQITYSPTKTANKAGTKHIALVGKGITFDTGGMNLKPGISMLGMKADMGGAAAAHSILQIAKNLKWDIKVSVFLAICDNKVSEDAYQPDEVVKSLSGKTIEIIHTDAEGRMALADTLFMASKLKPDLIIDFATLTGASVRAIGNSYSSVYTNNGDYHLKLIESGKISGERLWPFPIDEDYKRALKSDVADIMQCRPSGGCDHIEAAIFLKEFIGNVKNWVHIDLSSAKSQGGLAHVGTKETGFGPRVILEFLKSSGYIKK
jgi:leucyl aminopeptidase